jgi:hypothetical protein
VSTRTGAFPWSKGDGPYPAIEWAVVTDVDWYTEIFFPAPHDRSAMTLLMRALVEQGLRRNVHGGVRESDDMVWFSGLGSERVLQTLERWSLS